MTILKRIFSLMLSLLLILSVFNASCYAASNPALSVENKTVKSGERVTVAVSLANAAYVYGGNFTLQYDSSLLTVDSYSFGDILSEHTKNCNTNYQSSGNQIRVTFSGSSALSSSGTLVTLTFTAKASGTAALKFNAYKMYDENGSSIDTTSVDGSVEIKNASNPPDSNYILGDINGDGKVTATDARIVLRISARLEKLEDQKVPILAAADVNGDGKITSVDARKILRVSARLDSFDVNNVTDPSTEPSTEPSTKPSVTNNLPDEIVAFCSGTYYLDCNLVLSNSKEPIKMASKGAAKEIIYAELEQGVYVSNNIAILIDYAEKKYFNISELQSFLGDDFDSSDFLAIFDYTFGVIEIDSATSSKTNINGKEAYIWTITSGELKVKFTVINGQIKSIERMSDGLVIEVLDFSLTIPADTYISNSEQFKRASIIDFV